MAAQNVQIRPYDLYCPKCASPMRHLQYCAAGQRVEGCKVEPEHLHVTCTICGAKYLMEPKNP